MDRQRIVVVGAGVIGAALARRLATEGARVTVLDRAGPGQGTSRWSLAWLNANGKEPRAYHDLSVAGMRAWARLARDLDGDHWYRPVGNLRWAGDAEQRARLSDRVERLRSRGYRAELLDRPGVAGVEPALALPEGVDRVAWFPGEGYIRTEPAIAALVGHAERAGAEVRRGEAGRAVAIDSGTAGGSVVRTADGGRVPADTVVCCAGRWSPEVAGLAGAHAPIADPRAAGSPAPGLVVRVGPVPEPPVRVLHTPRVHLRPHGEDQAHLEAGDVAVDLYTPEADVRAWAGTLLERARRVVPSLARARVQHARVCVRPLPGDGLPIVGPATGHSGIYLVVTHSGVTLAAVLAELAARELLHGARPAELGPFHPERFR